MSTACTGKLSDNNELYFSLSHSITSFIQYLSLIFLLLQLPFSLGFLITNHHLKPLDSWTRHGCHYLFVITICMFPFNVYFSPNKVEQFATCDFFKEQKLLLVEVVGFILGGVIFKTKFFIETVQLSHFCFPFIQFHHHSLCNCPLRPFNANFRSN